MNSSHNLTRTPGKPCKHKTSINSDPHPTAINSTEKISDLRNSWIRYQVLRPNETKQSQGLAPPSLCMSDTVHGLEPTTRKKKCPENKSPDCVPFFGDVPIIVPALALHLFTKKRMLARTLQDSAPQDKQAGESASHSYLRIFGEHRKRSKMRWNKNVTLNLVGVHVC